MKELLHAPMTDPGGAVRISRHGYTGEFRHAPIVQPAMTAVKHGMRLHLPKFSLLFFITVHGRKMATQDKPGWRLRNLAT